MCRLSSIGANNTAITYMKLQDSIRASQAAREALKLDPLFAHRVLPQLIRAMAHNIHSEHDEGAKELLEMANRKGNFESMQQVSQSHSFLN